jgi:O-methyltransferase involved in polyketide biosynthesis
MSHIPVHEDDVVSLIGRAQARLRFPDLDFADPWAEDVLARLDLDPEPFDEVRLRAMTVRTIVIDGIVRHFFRRHPAALAISLFPGLCTRFSRIDNGTLHWLELDRPSRVGLKCELYRTPDRHMVAACCSLACNGWMRFMNHLKGAPALLVLEGALLRASHEEVDAFLTNAAQHVPPGTELVLDYDARHPLRPSSLDPRRGCLELPSPDGPEARYPRLRFVPSAEYPPSIERDLAGLHGVSRLFQGRGVPSVAHLRFT